MSPKQSMRCILPDCSSELKDITSLFGHCQKIHGNIKWTPAMARRVGGVACECGVLCKSLLGIQQHQKKHKNCPIFNSKSNNSPPTLSIKPSSSTYISNFLKPTHSSLNKSNITTTTHFKSNTIQKSTTTTTKLPLPLPKSPSILSLSIPETPSPMPTQDLDSFISFTSSLPSSHSSLSIDNHNEYEEQSHNFSSSNISVNEVISITSDSSSSDQQSHNDSSSFDQQSHNDSSLSEQQSHNDHSPTLSELGDIDIHVPSSLETAESPTTSPFEPIESPTTSPFEPIENTTSSPFVTTENITLVDFNKSWKDLQLNNSVPDCLFFDLNNIPSSTNFAKPTPKSIESDIIKCLDRLATNYLSESNAVNLFTILAFPKIGICPFITKNKISQVRKRLLAYPDVDWPSVDNINSKDINNNNNNDINNNNGNNNNNNDISYNNGNKNSNNYNKYTTSKPTSTVIKDKLILKYVRQGKLSRASRILINDSKIAISNDEETIQKLHDLHPIGKFPLRKNKNKKQNLGPKPNELDSNLIINAALSFKLDTGVGISSWSASLIISGLKSEKFRDFIILLSRQILNGTAPCPSFLCASRLIPLLKKNGSIRPISVGELFFRIASKSILRSIRTKNDLLPLQFGVNTPGGVEPIIYKCENILKSTSNTTTTSSSFSIKGIGIIDFRNAFNTISRDIILQSIKENNPTLQRFFNWSYGISAPLVLSNNNSSIIHSTEGVRQGDPIGPYLFSLGIRKLIQFIHDEVPQSSDSIYSYLDDMTILCSSESDFQRILSAINNFSHLSGLNINLDKSFYTSINDIKTNHLDILGSRIGSKNDRNSFLKNKIDIFEEKLSVLQKLSCSHEALLLLRSCVNQDLRHLLRSLESDDIREQWNRADQLLIKTIKILRGDTFLTDTNTLNINNTSSKRIEETIIHLPVRYGGLGLFSHLDTLDAIRECSVNVSKAYLNGQDLSNIGKSSERLDIHYKNIHEELIDTLPEDSKTEFLDLNNKISNAWLNSIPFSKQLHLTNKEISCYLKSKTLYNGTSHCLKCGNINSINHPETCNSASNFRVARHELLKKSLAKTLIKSGNKVTVEPFINKPTSELRADLSVQGSAAPNGSSCLIDLSVVTVNAISNKSNLNDITVTTTTNTNTTNTTTTTAIQDSLQQRHSEKIKKYQKLSNIQFIPFIISTAGTLHSDASNFLNRLDPNNKKQLRVSFSLILLRSKANIQSF